MRLTWFCAANAVCDRHLVPFIARCSMATSLLSLHSRTSCTGNRLYCANYSTFLDGTGVYAAASDLGAGQQLSRFEQRLCAAISFGETRPAPPDCVRSLRSEYLAMVEDLIWALTRLTSSGRHRSIHLLETYWLEMSCLEGGANLQ